MIEYFAVENFKAFGTEQVLPLKAVTVLFGPNSAGKSSFIHAFLFSQINLALALSDIHEIPISDDIIDLGGFRQFVYRQDVERTVSWTAGIRPSELMRQTGKRAGINVDTLALTVSNKLDHTRPPVGGDETSIDITLSVNSEPLLSIKKYNPRAYVPILGLVDPKEIPPPEIHIHWEHPLNATSRPLDFETLKADFKESQLKIGTTALFAPLVSTLMTDPVGWAVGASHW